MASSILLSPLRDRFDAFRAWHGSAREPGSGPWLRRGSFLGIVDLQASINRYLAEHNADPKLFRWKADPNTIIAAAGRGHQTLDSIRSHVRHFKQQAQEVESRKGFTR
jgi:hypothetical protein